VRNESKFEWQLVAGDWWYTFALALCLGVVVAGVLLSLRPGRRPLGVAICGLGLALGIATSSVGLNGSPLNVVDMDIHPYVSHLVAAAMLAIAVLAGTAVGALLVGGPFLKWKNPPLVVAGMSIIVVGLGVVVIVSKLDGFQFPEAVLVRPAGTDTSRPFPSQKLADGMGTPTGLAVAGNGDIAVVELSPPNLRLYSTSGSDLTLKLAAPIPAAPGGQAFHVAFHPDYPEQPFVYITAEEQGSDRKLLQVFRARVDSPAVEFVPIITGLPIGQSEVSNHFGGAIAFCGDALFVTTADTEPNALHELPLGTPGVIRQLVQDPLSGTGKVLRWKLDGPDVTPDGVINGPFPMYALGFRNPFGATCDPVSGLPVVADNGPASGHDQVRVIAPDSNSEWPISADRTQNGAPLFDTGEAHVAPTAIAVRSFGTGFEYLIPGFLSEELYGLDVDSPGQRSGPLKLLARVPGGAYAAATSTTGCVYYTSAEALFRLDDGRCP
jgi:hypothetical protein